ncbi:MAG: hypothetical protein Q7S33_04405 [Nanoarchaeota archaeon]|nr:hypothetical protein [Nanoarchaeota archaeon]
MNCSLIDACCWHKSPVNILLHYVAGIILIYGLWYHQWSFIISAIVIAIIGHIIQSCLIKENKGDKKNAKIKKK